MKSVVLIVSVLVSIWASAQDGEKLQPCMEIKKACESGLQRSKGKGLVKDCMAKVTNGETVAGVLVGDDVVRSCKEKHEK